MSLNHSPSIAMYGLILNIDAGNPKSYPGSGTIWTDLGTGKTDLSLLNSPTYDITNKGAFIFNGTTQVAQTSVSITYGNSTTWEAWVNRTSSVNDYNMFMGRYLPYFAARAGSQGFHFSNRISNVQTSVLTTGITVQNNTWYHVVCVNSYDGSTNTTMSIYINGVLNNSLSFAGTQTNYAYKFKIGDGNNQDSATLWYPFNGQVSNVKVYNRALNASEIWQNFNALRGRYGI